MPDALTFAELYGHVEPAVSDVRDGVFYGLASALEGTLVVSGDTPGNYPAVGEVIEDVVFGDSNEFTGTYVPTAVGDVRDGTLFGPGSSLEGTLVVTGGAPADPPLCTVTVPIVDQFGDPLEGVSVDFRFVRFGAGADPDSVVVNPPQPATSDANGLITVSLIREAQYALIYSVASGSVTKRVDITVPDAGTYTVVEPN